MIAGNEPAYPWGNHGDRLGGLTKRELFAAMAMQGFCADESMQYDVVQMAAKSVLQADALIAALEGK